METVDAMHRFKFQILQPGAPNQATPLHICARRNAPAYATQTQTEGENRKSRSREVLQSKWCNTSGTKAARQWAARRMRNGPLRGQGEQRGRQQRGCRIDTVAGWEGRCGRARGRTGHGGVGGENWEQTTDNQARGSDDSARQKNNSPLSVGLSSFSCLSAVEPRVPAPGRDPGRTTCF